MDRFSYSRNGDNGLVDHTCQLRVQIAGVETRGSHVAYQIRIVNVATRQSWDVSRRFSEFLHVRNALLAYFKAREGKKCPGCVNYEKVIRLFEFPRKHVFTSISPVVLNYRKVALTSFVALLASHTFTEKPKCPTCSGDAFTLVQDFLTQELTAAPAKGTVRGPDDVVVSTDAIRESIDVKRFMGTQHRMSKLRPVDSNGKFTTAAAVRKQQSSADKPRAAARKPQINVKHAAGEDLPSPPHSSTGSSSGSFGSMASPTAAPAAIPVPVARPRQAKSQAKVINEPVEDENDGEGSFVSFTAPAGTRLKRSSSRASRRSRTTSITMAVVVQTNRKKSEKKRLNFTRRRSSAASQPRPSVGSGDENDGDANEDEEINMDFLKIAT